jgi:hypothetical protein
MIDIATGQKRISARCTLIPGKGGAGPSEAQDIIGRNRRHPRELCRVPILQPHRHNRRKAAPARPRAGAVSFQPKFIPPMGQFDRGRIVNWKTNGPKRILQACQNLLVIDPVNAARSMIAASTWLSRARSAALNAPCAVQLSRIGTLLGFLDIDSLPVQPGCRMTSHPKRPKDPTSTRYVDISIA